MLRQAEEEEEEAGTATAYQIYKVNGIRPGPLLGLGPLGMFSQVSQSPVLLRTEVFSLILISQVVVSRFPTPRF